MNYKSAIKLLNSFDNFEKLKNPSKNRFLNLDRICYALKVLGSPEKQYPAILVGGTNGKGSTAFYLSEVLKESGYKVGLYTSPHLEDVRERMRVGNRPISENNFTRWSAELSKKITQNPLPQELGRLTYFEWLTLIAFSFFKSQKVNIAILEVGMGGRRDATNCVSPLLTLLTPISLDHTRELGVSLSKIAKEKSYLIHHRRPLLLAKQAVSARKVLLARAQKEKAPVYEEGKSFLWDFEEFEEKGKVILKWLWESKNLKIQKELQGKPAYLLQNISLAIKALELLRNKYKFKKISLKKAISVVEEKIWAGRFEIVRKKPAILLDGVHNPASAAAFSRAVLNLYKKKKRILIFGVSSDKNMTDILKQLKNIEPKLFIATRFNNPRAASLAQISKIAKPKFEKIQQTKILKDALKLALKRAVKDDLIIICGSLYLVGEARRLLKKPSVNSG